MGGKRERPIVTGKDAENFLNRCKLNEQKLKERNDIIKAELEKGSLKE
jgi:hypothetical protein